MYGKVFTEIFNSSLVVSGGWLATYVFMSFIALADRDGCARVAPDAMYRKLGFAPTGPTYEEFQEAIKYLELPDADSNSTAMEGRRIVPMRDYQIIEGNRGWFVVNYLKYVEIASADYRRDQARLRKQRERKRKGHALSRKSRHIDIDIDVDIKKEEECSELQIPLKTGGTFTPTPDDMNRWTLAFPTLDVPATLLRIAVWDNDNPNRRKMPGGIRKHISAWLSRDADKASPADKDASKPGGGRRAL